MISRSVRRTVTLLPVLGAFALSGCGDDDPFRSSATVTNAVTEVSMAAFSTGATAPSALDLVNSQVVRPELNGSGTVNFHLALDVDASGKVMLLPVLTLLAPPTGGTSIGLVKAGADFDAITRAPNTGYVSDSAVTASVGESWFVRVQAGLCVYGEPFYGKLEVDGVNTETRRLVVRFLINRNCGYRDLTLGLPRN